MAVSLVRANIFHLRSTQVNSSRIYLLSKFSVRPALNEMAIITPILSAMTYLHSVIVVTASSPPREALKAVLLAVFGESFK